MNLDTELVIVLLIMLGGFLFLLGTVVGKALGQREMDDVFRMHKLVSSIWRGLLLDKTKEYTSLLREYIKSTKE